MFVYTENLAKMLKKGSFFEFFKTVNMSMFIIL